MSQRRPRIGVTGPDRGGFPAWAFSALAIWRAGGCPQRLRPGRFPEGAALPDFDGLILGGGADIDPVRAKIELKAVFQAPDQEAVASGRRLTWMLAPLLYLLRRLFAIKHGSVIDPRRDQFEERCFRQALAGGHPVLGICRGSQLINVHFGGSLHGDLREFYGEEGNPDSIYPRKRVMLAPGSLLEAVLGQPSVRVNSLHRQAVDELGTGVVVVGRDHAGVVQAIAVEAEPWVLGVQWHPEFLPTIKVQQRLFRHLVATARGKSRSR